MELKTTYDTTGKMHTTLILPCCGGVKYHEDDCELAQSLCPECGCKKDDHDEDCSILIEEQADARGEAQFEDYYQNTK